MVKVGAITVGQSPRDDVVPEMKQIMGSHIEILECGALDNLSLEQVEQLSPGAGDYVLVTRMREGTPVTLAKKHVLPRMIECVQKLEEARVDLVAMLCTGVFPDLGSSRIVLRPDRLLEHTVRATLDRGSIGVFTPLKEQIPQTRAKWETLGLQVVVDHALPYAAEEQVTTAARRLAAVDVDLIVLDCIGFNNAMKKVVRDVTQKPVLLPRTLLARTIVELVG